MENKGLKETKQKILQYVKKTGNPYLTCVEIDKNKWLGISHCTIRNKIKKGEIPCLKVGVAYKIHYLDIVEFLEKMYKRKKI